MGVAVNYRPPNKSPCPKLQELIEQPVDRWSTLFNARQPLNTYKQETNNTLLIQGLDNLIPIVKANHIHTVFITGDLLSHSFNDTYQHLVTVTHDNKQDYTQFSYKTISYVLQQLQLRIPNVKIYLALGNNDSDDGDYKLPSSKFLSLLANNLSVYVDNKQQFINSYSNGGYFSVPFTQQVTIIGLNTCILSSTSSNLSIAKKQLNWLNQELAVAATAKRKVIILQHIPYSIDFFKTTKLLGIPVFALDSSLQNEYLQVLAKYSSTIITIYSGHFHSEYMSLINTQTPQIGTIAFNSGFGNNPGFKVIDVESSFAGFTTYYTDLTRKKVEWQQLYSFGQTYGNPKQITTILSEFPFTNTAAKVVAYRKYYNANSINYPQLINSDDSWKYYYCGINNIHLIDYEKCVTSH